MGTPKCKLANMSAKIIMHMLTPSRYRMHKQKRPLEDGETSSTAAKRLLLQKIESLCKYDTIINIKYLCAQTFENDTLTSLYGMLLFLATGRPCLNFDIMSYTLSFLMGS